MARRKKYEFKLEILKGVGFRYTTTEKAFQLMQGMIELFCNRKVSKSYTSINWIKYESDALMIGSGAIEIKIKNHIIGISFLNDQFFELYGISYDWDTKGYNFYSFIIDYKKGEIETLIQLLRYERNIQDTFFKFIPFPEYYDKELASSGNWEYIKFLKDKHNVNNKWEFYPSIIKYRFDNKLPILEKVEEFLPKIKIEKPETLESKVEKIKVLIKRKENEIKNLKENLSEILTQLKNKKQ